VRTEHVPFNAASSQSCAPQLDTLNHPLPNTALLSLVSAPITTVVDALHRSDLLEGLVVCHALLNTRIAVDLGAFGLQTLIGHDLARGAARTVGEGSGEVVVVGPDSEKGGGGVAKEFGE